jgi:uncharacterized protein with FMN-binding domain
MRRIALWFASTVAVLMLLAGYHTSFAGPLAATSTLSAYSAGTLADRTTPGSSAAPSSGGTTSGSTGSGSTGSGSTGSGSTGSGSTGSGGSAASGSGSSSTASSTVTGDTVQTQWGPVQVQLSVAGSRITGVTVLQYPNGNGTDTQINNYALPILVNETMSAQSASIDMVSGATYTSTGYQQSLQSALDRAGL